MSLNSTIADKARFSLRTILENVFVQESRLAATTQGYAWRVRGSPLKSIRRLFAEQGRQVDRWVGEINKVVRAFGISTKADSIIEANGGDTAAPRDAVQELLARHEAIIAELRGAVEVLNERDPHGDAAALLGGLLEFHETSAWMLRLLLESPERARLF